MHIKAKVIQYRNLPREVMGISLNKGLLGVRVMKDNTGINKNVVPCQEDLVQKKDLNKQEARALVVAHQE